MQLNTNVNRAMEAETISKNGISINKQIKRNIYCGSALLVMLFLFSSCATILCGPKQKIKVTGNINTPVQLCVDGETYTNVTLPTKVKIKRRGKTSEITAFALGYGVEKQELKKSFNPVMLLNNVAWYGHLIDLSTGAYRKSKQKKVDFYFQETNSTQEDAIAYYDFGMAYYQRGAGKKGSLARRNYQTKTALRYFQKAYAIDATNVIIAEQINTTLSRMDYLQFKAEKREANMNTVIAVASVTAAVAGTTAAVVSSTQSSSGSGGSSSSGSGSSSGSSGCNCAILQQAYTKAVENLRDAEASAAKAKAKPEEFANNYGTSRNVQTGKKVKADLERDAKNCGCSLH
ncbi:MAG: hypothetical protein FWC39_10975 [Bacteroidetes bacterium]|nr:hypothetical protein [Bacteroidota bacterium]